MECRMYWKILMGVWRTSVQGSTSFWHLNILFIEYLGYQIGCHVCLMVWFPVVFLASCAQTSDITYKYRPYFADASFAPIPLGSV